MFPVNASLQFIPLQTTGHPYAVVDSVIALIQQSGLYYETGPFSTAVEGDFDAILQLLGQIRQFMENSHCREWLLQVQFHVHADKPVTIAEKVRPLKNES